MTESKGALKSKTLDEMLKNTLTVDEYENLHKGLGVTPRKRTEIIQRPDSMDTKHLFLLAQVTGHPMEDIYLNYIHSR